jgi:hypothetical protein
LNQSKQQKQRTHKTNKKKTKTKTQKKEAEIQKKNLTIFSTTKKKEDLLIHFLEMIREFFFGNN